MRLAPVRAHGVDLQRTVTDPELPPGLLLDHFPQFGHDLVVPSSGHTPDLLLSGHHAHPQRPRRGGTTSPTT
ncbi:hypothetical protein ACWGJ2_36810 [Streptomyces sp. NPDC054796]